MKLKFLKNKRNFRKKISQINPNIYWNFILYSIFILIALSFVFGFWLFAKTNNESFVSDKDSGGQLGIVKKERLDEVLEYFSEREKKSNEILTSPSPVVDPSL